ncbi:hypothetical protein Pcac1_g29361 [Phytophthora cactorum]|nr:hypothetical protein Pcac1_g29361 [Phytophthora cactorum]
MMKMPRMKRFRLDRIGTKTKTKMRLRGMKTSNPAASDTRGRSRLEEAVEVPSAKRQSRHQTLDEMFCCGSRKSRLRSLRTSWIQWEKCRPRSSRRLESSDAIKWKEACDSEMSESLSQERDVDPRTAAGRDARQSATDGCFE